MIKFRHETVNYEIYPALAGAFGMMLMGLVPGIGRMILSGAILLLGLLYFCFTLKAFRSEGGNRFLETIDRINFAGAALGAFILLILLLALPGKLYLAIPAILVLAFCIGLNLALRYIYKIPNPEFLYQQVRLLLLAGLIVAVAFWLP